MTDQVAVPVKADRCRRLGELATELRDAYYSQLIGRRLRVLVESPMAELRMIGTACRYATVELPAPPTARRQFRDVTAEAVINGRIIARAAAG